jgi:hypothetical protein
MKPFTSIAAIIFAFISFMHLLRLVFGWEITFNGLIVPIWISVPGFLITALLVMMLWLESRR